MCVCVVFFRKKREREKNKKIELSGITHVLVSVNVLLSSRTRTLSRV